MEDLIRADHLMTAIWLGVMFLALFAIAKKWLSIRAARNRADIMSFDDGAIEGTLDDLRAAERALSGNPLEVRKRILETHSLIDRYSTLQGFSERYVSDLQDYLNSRGVRSTYLFQQTLPTGEISMMGQTGVFEFYVETDKLDEAKRLVQEFRTA